MNRSGTDAVEALASRIQTVARTDLVGLPELIKE